jgi:hypothetical protein
MAEGEENARLGPRGEPALSGADQPKTPGQVYQQICGFDEDQVSFV